jgi:hypothetical protein
MFQYAAGRALALSRDTELRLDLGWLAPRSRFVYELGVFRLEVSLIYAYRHMRRERVRELLGLAPRALVQDWRRDGCRFDPKVVDLPADARLAGYWQSEKYFAHAAAAIRRDFEFAGELDAGNLALSREMAGSSSVAVHVRRGDYVSDASAGSFIGVLPLPYYDAAARFVRERVSDARFFVFSDDLDWCRAELRLGGPTTFVDHNAGRGADDLRLMSFCRHHIIANSSFSWWGAWLARTQGQLVVAPERWLVSSDAGDVVPDRWHRL